MHQSKDIRLQDALRIVQYLKGTPYRGILSERNGSVVPEAYTDAHYTWSIVDRRSTTGHCIFMYKCVIVCSIFNMGTFP